MSLPKGWDPKVTAIQVPKDLDALSFNELIGSLMTHEIMMKRENKDELKKNDKSLAFKTSQSSSEEEGSDKSDDIVIFTRKFKRFI